VNVLLWIVVLAAGAALFPFAALLVRLAVWMIARAR